MSEKLDIDVREIRNEVTICVLDENGDGEILVHGKLGGCAFLNQAEQARRIEVLGRLTLLRADDRIGTGLIDIEIARLEKEMEALESSENRPGRLDEYLKARVKHERLKAVREVYR